MNHDNGNHGGHEDTPSSPPTLLKNPTATIYFDGLIFSAFDDKKSLYQSAILTDAEGHHLVAEVRLRGDDKLIFPTDELPWDSSHPVVKSLAPFWLYVDSGQGVNEKFSASLHLPDPAANDEQSFDRIFNFEKFHQHPFVPRPGTFAEFNFPQGTSYSAVNENARLKTVAPNTPSTAAVDHGSIHVSTLGAIDIDAVSDDASKKYIVLANQDGQQFFKFPLEADKHYEIKLFNVPIEEPEDDEEAGDHHHSGHSNDPEHHFLLFYDLFDLKRGEDRFLVSLPQPPSEQSPPCVTTTGRPNSGFGGG